MELFLVLGWNGSERLSPENGHPGSVAEGDPRSVHRSGAFGSSSAGQDINRLGSEDRFGLRLIHAYCP